MVSSLSCILVAAVVLVASVVLVAIFSLHSRVLEEKLYFACSNLALNGRLPKMNDASSPKSLLQLRSFVALPLTYMWATLGCINCNGVFVSRLGSAACASASSCASIRVFVALTLVLLLFCTLPVPFSVYACDLRVCACAKLLAVGRATVLLSLVVVVLHIACAFFRLCVCLALVCVA